MGYNDWRLIELVPSYKGFIEEDGLEQLKVTMRGFGRIMASQVQDGSFGVYTIYDDRFDSYDVKWYESHPSG